MTLDEAICQIVALTARVEALELLEQQQASKRPPPRRDGAFLAGVARTIGDAVFSTQELMKLAAIDRGFARHLEDHGVSTAKAIGCRLRSLSRKQSAIDGYLVTGCGRDVFGQQWAIAVVDPVTMTMDEAHRQHGPGRR